MKSLHWNFPLKSIQFFYHIGSEAASFESHGAASFISVSDNGVTV